MNGESWEHLSWGLDELSDYVLDVNTRNGWFDSGRTFGEGMALIHSEVSEAFEAYRTHGVADQTAPHTPDGPLPKPEGVGSELADVLIRLVDEARRHDIDLAVEVERKMRYNETRGYRHGGKKL